MKVIYHLVLFSTKKMKKVVLMVEISNDKIKQKAMKAVSGLSGVESVSVDMNDKKLTLTGDIDPVNVAGQLKKLCCTEILTVGPAKKEKKREEPPKKEEPKRKDEKKSDSKDEFAALVKVYEDYYRQTMMRPPYHCATVQEDHSGTCVIY